MKKILLALSLTIFILTSYSFKNYEKITTYYYYSFTGVTSQEQVNTIEKEMSALQYVESTKAKYKPEKGAAQVMLVVVTESGSGENNRQDFATGMLKQIVLKHNLTPGNLEIKGTQPNE